MNEDGKKSGDVHRWLPVTMPSQGLTLVRIAPIELYWPRKSIFTKLVIVFLAFFLGGGRDGKTGSSYVALAVHKHMAILLPHLSPCTDYRYV